MPVKLPSKFNFKIPKITEKHRNWVLGSILLAIFLLDYFLLMYPFQLRTLISIGPEISTKSKELKQARKDIKNIGQYRKKAIELRKKMQLVGNRILSDEEIPKILNNISKLASSHNVRVNQIMPLRDSKKLSLKNDEGNYYSISILINARGGYHDVGRFFNSIEKDSIFMNVKDFNIASNSDDRLRHTINMTIEAFILEKARN